MQHDSAMAENGGERRGILYKAKRRLAVRNGKPARGTDPTELRTSARHTRAHTCAQHFLHWRSRTLHPRPRGPALGKDAATRPEAAARATARGAGSRSRSARAIHTCEGSTVESPWSTAAELLPLRRAGLIATLPSET